MRVPNICLVLKLDNGKVVSIAHEQTDRQTDTQNHPAPHSNIDFIVDVFTGLYFHMNIK